MSFAGFSLHSASVLQLVFLILAAPYDFGKRPVILVHIFFCFLNTSLGRSTSFDNTDSSSNSGGTVLQFCLIPFMNSRIPMDSVIALRDLSLFQGCVWHWPGLAWPGLVLALAWPGWGLGQAWHGLGLAWSWAWLCLA